MPDPETALAMTAATTIVAAMTTSAWQATRAGIGRIFQKAGDTGSGSELGVGIEARLERSAERIANASDPDEMRQEQVVRWRGELEDLMHEHPDAVTDLRTLVEVVRQQLPPVSQQWHQCIEARDGGSAFGAIGPGSRVVVYNDRETPSTGDSR